jgi:hypothetical protein
MGLKPGKEDFFQNNLQNQIKYVIISKALVRRIFIEYFGGQHLTSMNIHPRKVEGSNGLLLKRAKKIIVTCKGCKICGPPFRSTDVRTFPPKAL